ncbi:MAG TPA: ATP-binding protein [Opitutaceae bacterium]|nr:ATP-binding protein [Opitutaceae bacterium]
MERAPLSVQARPLPVESVALLAASPTPAALLAWLPASLEPRLLAANAAAAELLGLAAGQAEHLLARFDDAHEHAFRRAIQACAAQRQPQRLRVLAARGADEDPVMVEAHLAPFPAADDAVPGESWLVLHFSPAAAPAARARPALTAETIGPAVYAVSRAAHLAPTLGALYESIYRIVRQFIATENLYIALVDEAEQMLRFVYARDEYDPPADRPLGRLGLTDIVYLTGRPLLVDRRQADRMLAEGTVVNHGYPAQVWLGVPLKVSGRAIGVLAVQDYHDADVLGEPERRLLAFIADQVAHAIAIRRAEAAAQAARAAAERAGRAKAEFLAAMSHELRTPLAVVLGYGEILAGRRSDPTVRQQADAIVRSSRQLLGVINRMLDYSLVETGARLPEAASLHLPGLVGSLEAEFAPRAAAKDLRFEVLTEGALPDALQTDAKLLRQVLVHLLGNAVKYTERGGIMFRVRADPVAPTLPPRQRIQFTVTDTGPGIAPAKMGTLFEPVAPGRDGGTMDPFNAGLGLAISHRLAEMLGARLTAVSTPGSGSAFTFVVTAPLAAPGSAPDASAQAEQLLRARLRDHPGALLVVDAEGDSRAVLAEQLAEVTGRAPRAVAGADAAGEAHHDQPAQVVLYDPRVAGGDAEALRRLLRAGSGGPFLIAVSSDHSARHVARCLEAGADDFLPRPLSCRALLTALLHALDRLEERRRQPV